MNCLSSSSEGCYRDEVSTALPMRSGLKTFRIERGNPIQYSKGKFRNQSKTLIPREGPPDALTPEQLPLRLDPAQIQLDFTVFFGSYRTCPASVFVLYISHPFTHTRGESIRIHRAGCRGCPAPRVYLRDTIITDFYPYSSQFRKPALSPVRRPDSVDKVPSRLHTGVS